MKESGWHAACPLLAHVRQDRCRDPRVLVGVATYGPFHQPIALSCIGLGQPGMYDVIGRLEIGEDSEPSVPH